MLRRSLTIAAGSALIVIGLAVGFRSNASSPTLASANTSANDPALSPGLQPTAPSAAADKASVSPKQKITPNVVQIKLAEDSGIRLRGGKLTLVSPDGDAAGLAALQAQLDASGVKMISKVFNDSEVQLDQQQADLSARSGKKLHNLNNWLSVKLVGDNGVQTVESLKKLAVVADATVVTKVTTGSVPDLTPYQMYRLPTPGGFDANYADTSGIPGARGNNVTVADVEFDWNHNHQDLSKLHLPAGASITPECDVEGDGGDHGTEVAGIIVGDDNGYGVTGVVPDASYMPASGCGTDGIGTVDDITNAINTAAQHEKAGDILLIELQTWDLNNNLLPMEYYGAVHDAIANATAAGVVVVELAGNGNVNLDSSQWGGIFTTSRPNSGAIMVGAGGESEAQKADPNHPCKSAITEHSRTSFSNYGSRVDIQNWGVCTFTTGENYYEGYNIRDPNNPDNDVYTFNFNGTSGASALTAGVAASASSAFEAKNGRPATPQEIKNLLRQNSIPQYTTPGGLYFYAGNIGPFPDLKRILDSISGGAQQTGTPPTVPTNVMAANLDNGNVKVTWNTSTDDTGVVGYEILRNGSLIATVPAGTKATQTYADATVAPATSYSYTVRAYDTEGMRSAESAADTVETAIFYDDFSSSDFSAWSRQTNMDVLDNENGVPRGHALSTASAPRPAYAQRDISGQTTVYYKVRLRVDAAGSNNIVLMSLRSTSGPSVISLLRTGSGYLALRNDNLGVMTTSTTPIVLGTAITLQIGVTVNGTSSTANVWVNGSKVSSLSQTLDLGTVPIGRLQIGDTNSGRTFEVYYYWTVAGTSMLYAN